MKMSLLKVLFLICFSAVSTLETNIPGITRLRLTSITNRSGLTYSAKCAMHTGAAVSGGAASLPEAAKSIVLDHHGTKMIGLGGARVSLHTGATGARAGPDYELANELCRNKFIGRTDHDIKKWFFQQAVECSEDHPVTSEEIQMLKEHKIPNHKNAKCLVGCVFKRVKWVDSKGMFDDKEAYKMSEEEYPTDKPKLENAKKLYEMCKEVNNEEVSDGEAGCERSALLAMCLTENANKLGFFT